MKLKHLLAAVLLPLALVAAACSDGSDSASTSEETDTTQPDSGTADSGSAEGGTTGDGESAAATEASDSAGDAMGSAVPEGGDANIAMLAAGNDDLSTLTRLVVLAGLLPTLRDGGPFTVFAPTNAAFNAVDPATLSAVRADRAMLADVLTLHVVPGELTAEDLAAADGTALTTVNGGKLLVEVADDVITVGGATVVAPDVDADNGVVHVVDSVITEPNA